MEEVKMEVPIVGGAVLVQSLVNEICTAVRAYVDNRVPAAVHVEVYNEMSKVLDTQFVETMTTALAHSDWFRDWINTNLQAFLRANGEKQLRQWFDNSLAGSNIHADISSIVRSELATQINNMLWPEVRSRVDDYMQELSQRMALALSTRVVPMYSTTTTANYK